MLPARVVPGGVRQLVRRRLGRVPGWARGLLELAAVAGRELDLAVLERLVGSGLELDTWLRAGADAAVLEVAEGRWRFAHDKLREQLLDDLPEAARPALHRRMAEAIEETYPEAETRRAYAEALLEHWRGAGEAARALDYMLILIPVLTDYSNDYPRATELVGLGSALLAQLPPGDRDPYQLQLHLVRGAIGMEQALESYRQAQTLACALGDRWAEAEARFGCAMVLIHNGQLEQAAAEAQAGLALATGLGEPLLRAKALRILGMLVHWGGQFEQARAIYQEVLTIATSLADPLFHAKTLNDLAVIEGDLGNIAAALAGFQAALAISESIGSYQKSAIILGNIAYELLNLGRLEEAQGYIERNVALARRIGNQGSVSVGLRRFGEVAEGQGELHRALDYYKQALTAAEVHGDWRYITGSLVALVPVQAHLDQAAARPYLRQLLEHLHDNTSTQLCLETIEAAAYVVWAFGQAPLAAELLGLLETRIYTVEDHRKRMTWLRGELEARLSRDVLAAARERGAARALDTTLTELRAWLEQGER